ncbi:MAG: response regulator [Leeuwenhoekiella sp.]
MKILYLEDNPLNVVVMEFMLKKYDLDVAINSAEAFSKLDNVTYDLLLLDIHLGEDIDGIDVLKAAREKPANRNTPAYAVTAFTAEADKKRFEENGFDDYFPKPVDRDRLRQRIEKLANSK